MKIRFYHWYNAVLSALLAMLGFESCAGADEYGPEPAEYGMPYASYELKGVVSDAEGKPIQGIKTSVRMLYDTAHGVDSTLTDGNGAYQLHLMDYASPRSQVLVVEDVDGELNGGAFESDTIDLSTLPETQTEKGDGHWYEGKFLLKGDVTLRKKTGDK